MNNRAGNDPTVEEFAICPRCGGFRKLVDVREEARKLGMKIAGDAPQFAIECCGYALCIDDERVHEQVVAFLQKQHACHSG